VRSGQAQTSALGRRAGGRRSDAVS